MDWTTDLIRWGDSREWRDLPERGALARFRAEACPTAPAGFDASAALRADYLRARSLTPAERTMVRLSSVPGEELRRLSQRRVSAVAILPDGREVRQASDGTHEVQPPDDNWWETGFPTAHAAIAWWLGHPANPWRGQSSEPA